VAVIGVLALLVLAVHADIKKSTINSVSTDGQTKCQRQITQTVSGKDIHIESRRRCMHDTDKTASVMVFDINTNGRPDIRIAFYQRIQDMGNSAAAFASFRIFFERVIEYLENNNVTGYQPGPAATDDKPGAIEFLSQKTWKDVEASVTTGANGVEIHDFNAASTDGEIEFGFQFSTDFVVATNNNHTRQLVPHSGKFSFRVYNHTYTDANAAGLAFRVFVLSMGGTRTKSKTDTDTGLDMRNSSGVNVEYLGNFASFFTWDDFADDVTGSKLDVHAVSLGQDVDKDFANTNYKLITDARIHVETIWFSVPHRTSHIDWDPYFGVPDSNSAAASLLISLMLAIACFFVTF